MKKTRNVLHSVLILSAVINLHVHGQLKNGDGNSGETKSKSTSRGPNGIVRTIKQDRNGAIWITSWEGVFKYDGKSFTNVTRDESSARFFSVLEDSKRHFWFASIGSGVYHYDGKSFQNFTTKDGLASDRVGEIYEDTAGNIWFGTENGASRYDGKSFRTIKMNEIIPTNSLDSVYVGNRTARTQRDSVHVSSYQNALANEHWTHNDVNAIVEDKTGKFWFGTRGNATSYDGKKFTTITNDDGKPFQNVRSIIKDQSGNIWLGGADGLWRYDGKTFVNFTQKFVGYVYEDKKGNIWTSSESETAHSWVLSRYDKKTLTDKKPTVVEIAHKPMIFGILEDTKGNIWFGAVDGVYRYDGKTITDFKGVAGQ